MAERPQGFPSSTPTAARRPRGRRGVLPRHRRRLRAAQRGGDLQHPPLESAQVPGNVCAVGSSLHRFGGRAAVPAVAIIGRAARRSRRQL